ncbi:MAG: zinc metalloprotease HtpX [bacterium]
MKRSVSYFKIALLFGVLSALLVAIGYLVMGRTGAIIFFVISLVMNLTSYWFSDKIALSMSGAQPLDESQAPEIYSDIRELTQKMNIPMPRVYMSPEMQPNAFATGRNPKHSAVCLTQGIVSMLNRDELRGVIAHELSHVKNYDVLIATVAAVFASAISNIANIGLFFGGGDNEDRNPIASILLIIIAPIAAMMIQMAISRSREFVADATGAEFTGRPRDLANALIKIDNAAHQIPMNVNPAVASLYIGNPFAGQNISSLFSTHPKTADRVAKLMEINVR